MDLTQLSAYLERDAAWVVFLNVLLEQAGLPVPAVPTLLMAGSIAASGGQLGLVLLAATVGSLIADAFWYAIGRRYGYQVLAGLCKISINPGSCVSQTEARFMRWGLKSLVIAKFIPGFSTVAPPIAGALRMPLPGFLIASAIGAALWAGIALVAGWAEDCVHELLERFSRRVGSGFDDEPAPSGGAVSGRELRCGLFAGWANDCVDVKQGRQPGIVHDEC